MGNLFSRRSAVAFFMATASMLIGGGSVSAQAFAGRIDLIRILPTGTPAFGQTIQMTVRVTRSGLPVKNAPVEFWFSGRHGVQSRHWSGRTDNQGYCTTNGTIPREWFGGIYGDPTWVDLNVSCKIAPAFALFRVRGKP